MATFNCQCGKVLENNRLGDFLYVFDEQEILAACQQVPGITLPDFLANWRRWALRDNSHVVYWKCPECGKVYEAAPAEDGEVYRTFERTDREDEVALNALGQWSKLYVLDSKFVADAEQLIGSQALFDIIFLTRWEYDYFLDPDEKMVLALKATTNESSFYYEDIDKKA